MPEDRSLDEFAGDDADDDEDVTPAEDDTDHVASDDGASDEDDDIHLVATDDIDPATTTSAWVSDGGGCEHCGDTVRRLWGEDGTLVCPDCTEW